jgi:hypothetical protein
MGRTEGDAVVTDDQFRTKLIKSLERIAAALEKANEADPMLMIQRAMAGDDSLLATPGSEKTMTGDGFVPGKIIGAESIERMSLIPEGQEWRFKGQR